MFPDLPFSNYILVSRETLSWGHKTIQEKLSELKIRSRKNGADENEI